MRALRFLTSASLWLAVYGLLTAPILRGVGLRTLVSEFRRPAAPQPEVLHAE
jgi:hypothetical protein